jgi:hypothetical protein
MGKVEKNRGAMERELFHIACHPGPYPCKGEHLSQGFCIQRLSKSAL